MADLVKPTSRRDSDVEKLKAVADNLRIERDAYWQDLFEANRYSAWLSAERQSLLDRLAHNPYQNEVKQLRAAVESYRSYVEYLEALVTQKEDLRFALENELRNISQE